MDRPRGRPKELTAAHRAHIVLDLRHVRALAECKKRGIDKSAVIRDALDKYLGLTGASP